MPLERIGFHIIDYWTSSICLLWHISLDKTCCRYIGYSFCQTARDLLYALSHKQDSTYHSLWWASCGPLVGTENSPNCKCFCHAGSVHHARGSKPLQQTVLVLPYHLSYIPSPNGREVNWIELFTTETYHVQYSNVQVKTCFHIKYFKVNSLKSVISSRL